MPVGKRNLAAIVVANVGSLPPAYARYAVVEDTVGSYTMDAQVTAVTVYSLASTDIPVDSLVVGALRYSGPSYDQVGVTLRKVSY